MSFDVMGFFPFLQNVAHGDTIAAAIIIVASLLVAKAIYFVFKHGIRRVTRRTKTDLDDTIIGVLERPLYLGIIIAGVFFALLTVELLAEFRITINQAFGAIAVLWFAYLGVRLSSAILKWYAKSVASKTKSKLDDTILPIFRKIIAAFILAIALMIILGNFGIEITPLIASMGIAGLAIALALQDTLSNLFSGMYVAGDQSVKVGDFVEIEGQQDVRGYVDHIGWRTIRLRTTHSGETDNLIIVPNSMIANSILTNFSYPIEETLLVVPVGVSYGSDLKKVERVTLDVAKKVLRASEGGVKENFEPLVRYNTFADSNITFDAILRVEHARFRSPVRHEFIKELKAAYDRNSIEISWPVRKVHMYRETGRKRKK